MKKFAYRQYSIRELYDSYTRDEIIFPSQYNEIPWIKQLELLPLNASRLKLEIPSSQSTAF